MPNHHNPAPRPFHGVMLSSTFTDLEQHRAILIRAIKGQGLTDVAMENDTAKPHVDVIDSSLQMVRDAAACILLISRKYGQTPPSPDRNPENLSITELEFNEAQKLGRPILLFVMSDKHLLREADVETDPGKKNKLNAFRERAKQMKPGETVHRVYDTFESLEDFTSKAIHAVAGLRRYLDERYAAPDPAPTRQEPDPIPAPPAFYAEPRYIGSHKFLGRQAQLDVLDDWAMPADPHPVLLFDAIGGSGKSMLTWEWAINHATQRRKDWAGRFWYSFYERGAIMADFCRRALAYITGDPPDSFNKLKNPELARRLLHHLENRPWLFVLDGLERVLVAYHRFDAAEVPDEEVNQPTDQIAHRDPCAAIRPEDDDLLRALSAAAPSKLLVTSRLVPRVLLNQAGQAIPGVLRVSLPGLRPADAEALLRSCGITGNSEAIQNYLKSNCDCHPLVTGVLAGLINDYLKDKGNFDAWAAEPAGGGQLNLANLDLVQRRNHILKAAIEALPKNSYQLLATLALVSEAVDYATLSALDPSPELARMVRDLEHRGLLQYEAKRYDLHPVVRGIAAGALQPQEKDEYGQRVVDYFSAQAHRPYAEAETLDDVRNGLHIVRTLLKMGRYQPAYEAYCRGLSLALYTNLEASAEMLSLLRPFFPQGWAILPGVVDESSACYLANAAAMALERTKNARETFAALGASLPVYLWSGKMRELCTCMFNISRTLEVENRLAQEDRCTKLALDLATLLRDKQAIFTAALNRFWLLSIVGQWSAANDVWDLLHPMGRNWSRASYRPGTAEFLYARLRFLKGDLREDELARAEQLTKEGKGRSMARELHFLRGSWKLERGECALAEESLHEAVSMARAVGQADAAAETQLAIARCHLGQLADPQHEAVRLASASRASNLDLAELWLAIGDREQAKKHALAAYERAWADGEPYVSRYELNKSRALLEKLGAEIPDLPPYDPAKNGKFPGEDEIKAAIEKLRAEKEAKDRE
jgi:hypothetical protein